VRCPAGPAVNLILPICGTGRPVSGMVPLSFDTM
jgi:hypothetical protein